MFFFVRNIVHLKINLNKESKDEFIKIINKYILNVFINLTK